MLQSEPCGDICAHTHHWVTTSSDGAHRRPALSQTLFFFLRWWCLAGAGDGKVCKQKKDISPNVQVGLAQDDFAKGQSLHASLTSHGLLQVAHQCRQNWHIHQGGRTPAGRGEQKNGTEPSVSTNPVLYSNKHWAPNLNSKREWIFGTRRPPGTSPPPGHWSALPTHLARKSGSTN